MKRDESDPSVVELTDAEKVVQEWHTSLLDTGYSHAAADEQILLRTPTNGMSWKVLADTEFRKYLHGIKFWGPLAKNDHVPSDEPLPRILFLDDDGNEKSEAQVRRLGPDLYVIKDPDCDMEHLVTTQEVKDDNYLAFIECGASFCLPGDYASDCDKLEHHKGPHEAADPLDDTGKRRVRWEGGGSCAGDPLPYRNVEYIG